MSATAHDTTELRSVFRQKAERELPALLDQFLTDLHTDGDVEDKRKAISLLMEVTGWKEAPPKDPRAGLPMANITINLMPPGGGVPQPITAVVLTPTSQMLDFIDINAEVASDD